jgi:S1-C subfamily serine protease
MLRTLLSIILVGMPFASFALTVETTQLPASFGAPAQWGPQPTSQDFAVDTPGHLLGASVIKQLFRGMQPDQAPAVRSAGSKLYERLAPSVVLIATESGMGSGTIIDRHGMVLTNWHVIKDAEQIAVAIKPKQKDGRITKKDLRSARIVKVDEVADLALIELVKPPQDLKAVEFAEPDSYKIGQDVHAIGHPNDQNWTYTRGFISQIRLGHTWRTTDDKKCHADLIQTQTPINPGNSGGPLFDNTGKLIGINTVKAEGEGLNFAIAVTEIQRFIARTGNREVTIREIGKTPCKIRYDDKAIEEFDGERGTIIRFDSNCDDKPDGFLFAPDNKNSPSLYILTWPNGDIRILVADNNHDRKWDVSLHYEQGNDEPVAIGLHPDGKITPTSYEPYFDDSDKSQVNQKSGPPVKAKSDQPPNKSTLDLSVNKTQLALLEKYLANKIDDQVYRKELIEAVIYESIRAGLEPNLVIALIENLSEYRKYFVSETDARGLMAIKPEWVEIIGKPDHNIFHVNTNLRYGCTILRHMLDKNEGDLRLALTDYYSQTQGNAESSSTASSAFVIKVLSVWKTIK